ALLGSAAAHTWPERTTRLAPNGTMVGNPGFERSHHPRGSLDENKQVWLLPPNGGAKVFLSDAKITREDQRTLTDSSYSKDFPMLNVAPGDFVAIQYTENGHVTRSESMPNQPRPVNRGTVYVYGTTENDLSNSNLIDIHLKWTADGTGGNKQGKLLATRNYDDGQCHEAMSAAGDPVGISKYRFQNFNSGDGGLSCQTDFQIPTDIAVGKTLTVIWVWDWPVMSEAGVAVTPASYNANSSTSGKPYVVLPELYTGVVDYKIVDPCDDSLGSVRGPTCKAANGKFVVQFAKQPNIAVAAIKSHMMNPFLVQVPQAGFAVSEATADLTDIPLGALVGVKDPKLPLDNSILAANANGGDSANKPPPQPSPSPSPAAPPPPASSKAASPTPASSKAGSSPKPSSAPSASPRPADDDDVLTVTVTVPETTIFITSTRTP
ncbi:hypothetical protein B0T26DRAFT_602369, partial [Lasiosphaeria miniovina]